MIDDQIKKLAVKAGFDIIADNEDEFRIAMRSRDVLQKFADLVASKEREACAAIVDAEMEENAWESNASVVLNNVAAEIRARGE